MKLSALSSPRSLETIFQDFINALAARIATHVSARLNAEQNIRPRLMSVKDAAYYISRTEKSVRHLASQGAFPQVRADDRIMFDVQDLDRWIEQNKVGTE
jgi:hypothetical protein